jgi:calcium binding protein 39
LNLSSQQQQQQQHKTNASALVHSLLLDSNRKEIMITLLEYLNELPFETRKDVSSIFNYLLVCGCVLDGQEEQTFGNGAGNDRWMMISSLSSSQQANDDDAVSLSYVQTMLQFVEYVNEYYGPIMKHIVEGHYVAGTIQNSGDSANASGYGTTKAASSIKTVDVALHCGTMLRSTLRHAKLYANLIQPLHTANFVYPFLNVFVNQPNFEVASDALETLRLILHPNINAIAVPSFATTSLDVVQVRESLEAMMESTAAMFLEREYEAIFVQRFNVLLLSAEHANYITRRVSLQILSAVLLTRSNYNVMIRYVSSRSNLKTIMMLLSDSSAHITLEAFHVFKIFVANPNKPMAIVRILADNKVKLVKYLTGLHREKEVTDDQFRDEKALVISTLQEIEYNPSDGS